MTTTQPAPTDQIVHVQSTSIRHLIALAEGTALFDLQPITKKYNKGDSIIYKAHGDTYDEKLLRFRVLKIEKGWSFGATHYQLLILDYEKEEFRIKENINYVAFGMIVGFVLAIILHILLSVYS